jgi:hypothetical protein
MTEKVYPLVITECPKCGDLSALRSKHAPAQDSKGVPVDGWLIKSECMKCFRFVAGFPMKVKEESDLDVSIITIGRLLKS